MTSLMVSMAQVSKKKQQKKLDVKGGVGAKRVWASVWFMGQRPNCILQSFLGFVFQNFRIRVWFVNGAAPSLVFFLFVSSFSAMDNRISSLLALATGATLPSTFRHSFTVVQGSCFMTVRFVNLFQLFCDITLSFYLIIVYEF